MQRRSITNLAPIPAGDWAGSNPNPATQPSHSPGGYKRMSLVSHNNSTWLALRDTIAGEQPGVNQSAWMLFAQGAAPATHTTAGNAFVATDAEVQNGVKDASRGNAPAFVDVSNLKQAKNGIGLGRFDQANDFTVMHSPNGQLGLYIHDNGLWGVWDDASKADCPLPLTRGGTASRTPYDARLALNVPAWPSNDGPGIFGTIFFSSNTAATIPAGGVYAYWCFCRSADGCQRFENVFSGIAAGGSIVGDGVTWGQEKWLCYWGFI